MELGKTRTKMSIPDMFNFYVTLAGHDMVNDAGRAAHVLAQNQRPMITNESAKKEGPSENMGFNGKTV